MFTLFVNTSNDLSHSGYVTFFKSTFEVVLTYSGVVIGNRKQFFYPPLLVKYVNTDSLNILNMHIYMCVKIAFKDTPKNRTNKCILALHYEYNILSKKVHYTIQKVNCVVGCSNTKKTCLR